MDSPSALFETELRQGIGMVAGGCISLSILYGGFLGVACFSIASVVVAVCYGIIWLVFIQKNESERVKSVSPPLAGLASPKS